LKSESLICAYSLSRLKSGKIRTAEIRNDGQQIDTTDAHILWLKKGSASNYVAEVPIEATYAHAEVPGRPDHTLLV
jgi:hypothetical protein